MLIVQITLTHGRLAESMAFSYLKNRTGVKRLLQFPDHDVKRLKTMVIATQCCKDSEVDPAVINGAYNLHTHAKSSCSNKSAKYKVSGDSPNNKKKRPISNCDCRYS